MMEFFVLGQVPGTNFQITFNAFLLGCALAGIFVFLKIRSSGQQTDLQLVIRPRHHLGLQRSEPQLEIRDDRLSVKF